MGYSGNNVWLTDTQKIGVGLSGLGGFFLFLGCLLLFNRGLLAMGNVSFISGLVLVIGPKKAGAFFLRRNKWKGSIAFAIGLALILYRYTIIGMIIELFGFLNLFGDFFPYLIMFGRRLPIIGSILCLPMFAKICDRAHATRLPV